MSTEILVPRSMAGQLETRVARVEGGAARGILQGELKGVPR
jgi:hypothetical protein